MVSIVPAIFAGRASALLGAGPLELTLSISCVWPGGPTLPRFGQQYRAGAVDESRERHELARPCFLGVLLSYSILHLPVCWETLAGQRVAGTWTGPRVAGILLLAGGLSAAACLFADTAGSGLAAIVVALRSLVRLQICRGSGGMLVAGRFRTRRVRWEWQAWASACASRLIKQAFACTPINVWTGSNPGYYILLSSFSLVSLIFSVSL